MKTMDDNPKPRPLSLEEKLQQAQRDRDHWSKVAALPELSPKAAEFARNAARSAAAEVELRLREKALAWQKLSPQEKLAKTQADHRLWSKVAASPGLSPEAKEFATNSARSYGAALKLYERAVAWEKMTPEQRVEEAKAHERKLAPFAVPLTNFIAQRQASKARRAETVRRLLLVAQQQEL